MLIFSVVHFNSFHLSSLKKKSFASNLVVYSHSDACLMQSSSSSSSSSTTSSTSSPQQLLHSFITKYLSSRADLDIAIRPLSTGISQNVHGEVNKVRTKKGVLLNLSLSPSRQRWYYLLVLTNPIQ